MIIIRYLLGLREVTKEDYSLLLDPNIPQRLISSGRKLALRGYRYRDIRMDYVFSKYRGNFRIKAKVYLQKPLILKVLREATGELKHKFMLNIGENEIEFLVREDETLKLKFENFGQPLD